MNRRTVRGLALSVLIAAAAIAMVLSLAPRARPAASSVPLSPYVQVSDARTARLARQVAGAGLQRATLAFIVSGAQPCSPAWGGAGPIDRRPFAADVAAMRHAGVQAALSFGGQLGKELARTCSSPEALAAAYSAAAKTYGITSLDFDLEGPGLTDRPALPRRAAALAQLQRDDPRITISLTLPVATYGLPPEALAAVRAALDAGVRVKRVNVMAMNFGDDDARHPRGRMAVYARSAALATHRQLAALDPGLGAWSALAVTVMIGQNDTRSEVFTLRDARTLAQWARRTGIGGLGYWSFDRDRSCPAPSRSEQDTCSGLVQRRWAFASVLHG